MLYAGLMLVLMTSFVGATEPTDRQPKEKTVVRGVLQDEMKAPVTVGRINLGYWEKDELKTALVGALENGKIVAISALGSAKLDPSGAFAVFLVSEEVPKEAKELGLWYQAENQGMSPSFSVEREDGAAIRIPLSKNPAEVQIGRIVLKKR